MNRTALLTIIGAIIVAALIGVAAIMLMGTDGSTTHQMDDGSTMTGMMNSGTSP